LIYQPGGGSSLVTRHLSLVGGRFLLDVQNRIRFSVGPYDHTKRLVIDPSLVYSTCLGAYGDQVNGVALDSSGNAYVTGTTYSYNFPTMNPFQATNKSTGSAERPASTAFVAKLNSAGSALVYSTYLGGSGQDGSNAIAVDSAGSAYVTGWTCSSDFPTALPLQASLKGACDPFVTKLNPAGTSLVYSTYLGGSSGSDTGAGIAVDSSGSAYLTGGTRSSDFPTANPLQPSLNGSENAFVSKLNPSGSALVYSTYLGGSDGDNGAGIAVDSSGNAYLTGAASSPNFPTVNPIQTYQSKIALANAFVAKLNPGGSALIYSTFLGGSGSPYPYYSGSPSCGDEGLGIAIDSTGVGYVTGSTCSADFPTVNPIQTYQSKFIAPNAFVAKLNAAGSALIYSTFLGGSGCQARDSPPGGDEGLGIAIDSTGVAYVAGSTCSPDFPTVNAIQAGNNDSGINSSGNPTNPYTGFVACLNAAGSALAYSTYLGGTFVAEANAIAVDSADNAHVGGGSLAGFPTVNPIQANNGVGAFVVMISPPPAVTLLPTSLNFGTLLGGTTSATQSVTLTPLSNAKVNLSSIATSGDFALATTATSCPYTGGTLAAGATCTIDVTFTPTATGTRPGTVTVTYTGEGSPEAIALSGVGIVAAANVSPASLTFANQDVGSSSSPQVVTLSNPSTIPLTVSTVTISSGWTQSNNCTAAVAANSSCSVDVSFQPTVYGPQTGTLTFTDYANNSPQTVTLSGTALAPVVDLSATMLSFAGQTVSTASAPQTITLTNTGNGALTPFTITETGDFTQTNTCGGSVAAGANCSISVTFKPTAGGSRSGALTLTDNASNSPQTIQLSGTGMDFQMSSSTTSQTVTAGETANYSLTLNPESGYDDTVNLTCTGAPSLSTCTLTPNQVTLKGTASANVAVAVSTTAPSLAPSRQWLLPPSLRGLGRMFCLYAFLGLASLAALARARKRRAACLLGGCLLLVVLWAACGGGGGQVIHTQGTPPGTYTVDVTATDATTTTLTHTLQLTLTVD
jgi:hypothetical protein